MNSFLPCPQCRRHVRASESACPFCAAPTPDRVGPAPRVDAVVTGRYARAAILFMGAATSACSGSGEPTPVPFYGPAVVDAGSEHDSGGASTDAGTGEASAGKGSAVDASAGNDSGQPLPVPFYGPAIVDAGPDD